MHRLVAATVCLISLATSCTAAVGASGEHSSDSFEFTRGDATWKGRVSSEASACELELPPNESLLRVDEDLGLTVGVLNEVARRADHFDDD